MYCPNPGCIDFQETEEPGEYRDDVEVCPKCGARLVHERPDLRRDGRAAPEDEEDAGVPEGPLVVAAAFNYHQDADLAASMLRANGVQAVVFADDCGGTDARVGFGSRARLMVSERDAEAAHALLEQEVGEPDSDGA